MLSFIGCTVLVLLVVAGYFRLGAWVLRSMARKDSDFQYIVHDDHSLVFVMTLFFPFVWLIWRAFLVDGSPLSWLHDYILDENRKDED